MKKKGENKKRISWKRTYKNNVYMLGIIVKACPGILILASISTVLGAVHSFLLNTYLYQYALNALQEGIALKTILITLGCMFVYILLNNIFNCYFELKHPKVQAYIQNLLQKKAAEVELACFENSKFYDIYVKAIGEAANHKRLPFELVIMDEPSSALDLISEYELNRSILQYAENKTIIFISHRLSTTRMADRIYMFADGKAIESGSHDELMKQNGKYAEMYRVQAKKYRIS